MGKIGTLVASLVTAAALQGGGPMWDHFSGVADVAGGGKLFLILLDVDGDGRKEIFLAPSETCGNGGCTWNVYSPTPAPNQVRYLGDTSFSSSGYLFTPGTQTLTSCWHMSAAYCALDEQRFQNGEIMHRSLGECRTADATCLAQLGRIRQWQRDESPPVLTADVPRSGELRTLQWRQGSARASGLPDLDALQVR